MLGYKYIYIYTVTSPNKAGTLLFYAFDRNEPCEIVTL